MFPSRTAGRARSYKTPDRSSNRQDDGDVRRKEVVANECLITFVDLPNGFSYLAIQSGQFLRRFRSLLVPLGTCSTMAISLAVADLPVNLRSIQPYLEIADDYESNDPCISYWCRIYALKQGFILERVEEDLSFLLVLMEVLGKNKQDLQSKIEITDVPVARAHLEGATQKLLSWAENMPPLESLTKSETLTCVVAKVFQSAAMLLDVRSMFGEPNEGEFEKKKYTELHGKNSHREFHTGSTTKKSNILKLSENLVDRTSREIQNDEKKNTESPLTTAMDDDQNQAQSQKVTKQDERKKIYGRLFLLQLLNHPVSQKKPEGLPSLEIVRNKIGRNQIIADKLLGVHQQQYQQSPNVNPKTIDLIYSVVHKDREEQKRELNNSQFQEPFIPMDRRSRDSIDYRWNSVHNSDSRGGNVKLDIKQLRILKVPARDADQAVTSLDTGGKGLISWDQVTSSGMAQSLIGGVGGEKQHSGTYEVISKVDSTPRGSDSFGNSNSSATPSSQVNTDFQHSLEKYLRDATQLKTTDDICSWIQKQYVGEVNSAFVRALATAVMESSIEGSGKDSKLNNTALKNRTEVLRRYVNNIADRELQLLFAVQDLVTQRQQPKGLMQGIFETLYDSVVVSEEGFESWVCTDDPLEREDKAVALQVKSFFTWLKEADPESDEDEYA